MFIDFIIIFKNNYKKIGRIIKYDDYNILMSKNRNIECIKIFYNLIL